MKESPEVHFTPEQELLLWSIRVDHTKDQRIEEILKAGVDWNYVQETAIQHGIIPLLYKRLKEEMEVLVPSEELMEFRKLFMANAVRNIRMTQQLLKVLDLLADAGVEAMPFKGPALAIQAYGDLSMRSFTDIDIVIHLYDFDQAYYLLSRSGYLSGLKHHQAIFLKKTGIELSFTHPTHFLDVHWAFAHKFMALNLDSDKLFEKSIFIQIDGNDIRSLSPEDTLILLCIHGTNHRWFHLKWIADVIFLIHNNPDINWDKLFKEAVQIKVTPVLYQSLNLAKLVGGLNYPENIHGVVAQGKNVAELFYTKLFARNTLNSRFIFEIFLTSRSGESISDQILYLSHQIMYIIFTPKSRDLQVLNLPWLMIPLYYIIRPFRLLRDNLLGVT